MKLYNFFKPHMIEIDGFFYLRRLSLFGWWEYLDKKADVWWMKKKRI